MGTRHRLPPSREQIDCRSHHWGRDFFVPAKISAVSWGFAPLGFWHILWTQEDTDFRPLSLSIRFRPGVAAPFDKSFQYNRNPARCQPITVAGVTISRLSCQPAQNRRIAIQKN